MADVRFVDAGRHLHLDTDNTAVGALHDEVHLVVTIAGSKVSNPRFGSLRCDPHGQRDERLEEPPRHVCAPSRCECRGRQVEQPGRERRIGELMLGRLLEARQRATARAPSRNRIEQPELCEMIAVRHRRGLRRLVSAATGRRFCQSSERRGCRRRRGVGREPSAKRLGSPDSNTVVRELPIDDAVDVGVEEPAPQALGPAGDPGETARFDGLEVVDDGEVGRPVETIGGAAEYGTQAHRVRNRSALVERHRSHAHRQDASGTAVRVDSSLRSGASGEDETTGRRTAVDSATDRVPHFREPLPLVDQLPEFEGAGDRSVDIRQLGTGDVLWRRGGEIRHVTVVGESIDLLDAVDTALTIDDLQTILVPAGYTDLSEARYPTWQFGDWSVGTTAALGDDTELYISTWQLDRETRAIDQGLVVSSELADGTPLSVVRAGNRVATVFPPEEATDDELEQAVASIELVPAADLSTTPLFTLGGTQPIERSEPVAGGEITDGRWLAVDATRPSEAADGRHCLYFLGVVEGFRGCTEPGAVDLTICRHIGDTEGKRLVLITTAALDTSSVSVTANGEPLTATVEASGGLTFVTTTVEAIGYELRFASNGRELCTT